VILGREVEEGGKRLPAAILDQPAHLRPVAVVAVDLLQHIAHRRLHGALRTHGPVNDLPTARVAARLQGILGADESKSCHTRQTDTQIYEPSGRTTNHVGLSPSEDMTSGHQLWKCWPYRTKLPWMKIETQRGRHGRPRLTTVASAHGFTVILCPVTETARTQPSRILILVVHHGSTHVQIARVVEKALRQLRPGAQVEIVDVLAYCPWWFRAYYNSFEIPMKYWPGLWEHIETRQHQGESSGPLWLFRWGTRPLFRFIDAFAPHVVVATEVGLCEMAVLHKRQARARYSLVGIGALDFERPWAQPEV